MAEKKKIEKKNIPATQIDKGKATGLRVGAWILWILAIATEVVGILLIRKTIYLSPEQFGLSLSYEQFMLYAIIAVLVLDLIFVLIGSKLWKDANHYDPVEKGDSGIKKFFQNQMGLVVAIIAFAPILILLLTDKDTFSGKNKKVVSIIAVIALILAVLLSVDFNAPVAEEYETKAAEQGAALSDTVYWTRYGHSYHVKDNDDATTDGVEACSSLGRTVDENLFSGTLEEAYAAGRYDPCDFCVPQPAN